MENLTGMDMGIWSENGDTAFEPAAQTLANEEVLKEEQTQKIENAAELKTPQAFENDGFVGGNENQEDAKEAAKRAEHEAAEAKRKAEWEAKQQEKKAAEQEELERLKSMSDEDVMMKSMKRISEDTERLTRKNLKDCISEHIQTMCLEDPAFARLTLHPKKSMVHCFWYVNRMAGKFIEQEVKDMHQNPKAGYYGSDVPDGLCYQWAEEYFRDKAAMEDKEEGNEDSFIPKPYHGKFISKNKSAKKAEKKQAVKTQAGNKEEKAQDSNGGDSSSPIQLSLFELEGDEKAV